MTYSPSTFTGSTLTCIRGEHMVFDRLDFTMREGGMLLLVGFNGSGKSSLLRMIAGLLPPAEGTLNWNQENTREEPDNHNARLHYVGHQDALKPMLSVYENLKFWATMHGGNTNIETRVTDALEAFDIAHLHDTPARFLSAGQRRRTSLARILASPAPLWLLDEPTTALDADTVAKLEAIIAQHRSDGGMAVVSTHTPLKAENITTLDLGNFQPRYEEAAQ